MNMLLRKSMSLAEFLAWEERQEPRYEFDGFAPVAMTGGTAGHDRITFNLNKVLDAQLAGSPCKPFGPNVKIIAGGKVRYPDTLVTCSPVDYSASLVADPVVVFEAVSEDTARIDRIDKVRDCQATGSIRRCVILEQTSIGATVFAREGEKWHATVLIEGDTIELPELGIALALSECYAGLDLPRRSGGDTLA